MFKIVGAGLPGLYKTIILLRNYILGFDLGGIILAFLPIGNRLGDAPEESKGPCSAQMAELLL
jgi:hypothetical protein